MGKSEELVGRITHRADDDDHALTLTPSAHNMVGDKANPLKVGNRTPAVLLDDDLHPGQPNAATSIMCDTS